MIRALAVVTVAALALAAPALHARHANAPPRVAPRLLALDDVHDCAFAPDGRVVAATSGGLLLGDRVLTALDGLPDTRVEAVVVAPGHVLVQTPAGAARVALSTARVSDATSAPTHRPPSAPPSFEVLERGLVRKRVVDGDRTCIATSDGLFVGQGASPPVRVVRASQPSLPTADVAALAAGDGALFVGTFDRGVVRLHEGALEPFGDATLNPNVNALAWDGPRHALWAATARGLFRCHDAKPTACRRVGDAEPKHAVLVTSDGHVAAGGDGGLLFAAPDGELEGTLTRKGGAPFRAVWALAEALDGTVFVGTTSGVFWGSRAQLLGAPRTLSRVAMVTGALPDDWVTALALRGSQLLVGTYNAGLVSFARDGNALVRDGADPSLGYVNPGGLTWLPDGDLAVSTMDGLRIGTPGAFRRVPTLGRDVTAVSLSPTGERWVASRRGVTQF